MENVITDLGERRRRKQWKFERSMLRSLSIEDMRKDVNSIFFSQLFGDTVGRMYLMDFCLDVGIDAFLLGSEFGKFGYYGETAKQVQKRCKGELHAFIHQTASQFFAWFTFSEKEQDEILIKSREFIYKWWTLGFNEGEKKYRLRLH